MEAGLALGQAMGSGCAIGGGLARYSLCSSLQQTHLATSSKLTTAREGQRSSSAFTHPTRNVLILVSPVQVESRAYSPGKKGGHGGEQKPFQGTSQLP